MVSTYCVNTSNLDSDFISIVSSILENPYYTWTIAIRGTHGRGNRTARFPCFLPWAPKSRRPRASAVFTEFSVIIVYVFTQLVSNQMQCCVEILDSGCNTQRLNPGLDCSIQHQNTLRMLLLVVCLLNLFTKAANMSMLFSLIS